MLTSLEAQKLAAEWILRQPEAGAPIELSGSSAETPRSWVFGVRCRSGRPVIGGRPVVVNKATGLVFHCRDAYLEFVEAQGWQHRIRRWLSRLRFGY